MGVDVVYSRRVSSEEAKEGYFLVLKNKLPIFPPLGVNFKIVYEGKLGQAKVESYHCECRGPELPHEHYFIRWPSLKKGMTIQMRKNTQQAAAYELKLS